MKLKHANELVEALEVLLNEITRLDSEVKTLQRSIAGQPNRKSRKLLASIVDDEGNGHE